MKKMILAIIIAAWPLFLPAQTPYAGFAMRSTSSYSAMTTTMRAPTVYEPFTTSSPSEATLASDPSYAPPGRSLRRDGGPGGGFNGGTTNQPGLTPPVGDALLPLCLLALCYLAVLAFRACKHREEGLELIEN